MTVIFLKDGVWRPSWIWSLADLKMQNNMQNWIPRTRKPLRRHILQHSVTIIKKNPKCRLAANLDIAIRDVKMQKYTKKWILHTRKPLKRHILQHSVTIILKIVFHDGVWRQS